MGQIQSPQPKSTAVFFSSFSFTESNSSLEKLTQILSSATRSISVCVMSISPDSKLVQTLESKAKNGVKVRVFTSQNSRSGLRAKGFEVRSMETEYSTAMHHKFFVVDDGVLVTGSLNWTRDSFHNNSENCLVTTDPRIVRGFVEEFERLWGGG